ncbi:hypothetical protein SSTU70S_04927 [Stutzerimonas stutzeri]
MANLGVARTGHATDIKAAVAVVGMNVGAAQHLAGVRRDASELHANLEAVLRRDLALSLGLSLAGLINRFRMFDLAVARGIGVCHQIARLQR